MMVPWPGCLFRFFLAVLLFLLFGLVLGWLPVSGYIPVTQHLGDVRHMILPTIALGFPRAALLTA